MVSLHYIRSKLSLCLSLLSLYCFANTQNHYKNPILLPFVNHFIMYARQNHIELNTQYLELDFIDKGPENMVAYCSRSKLSNEMIIKVVRSQWENLNVWERWIVLAHESGHCFLRLDHRDDGVHIMNTALMNWHSYDRALIAEMFDDYKHHRHLY